MKEKFLKLSERLFKIYLIISVVLLSVGFYYLFKKLENLTLSSNISLSKPEAEVAPRVISNSNSDCGQACRMEIDDAVAKAIATISAVEKTQPTPQTKVYVPTAKPQIVFIPFSGPFTTTKQDWIDVPGTDVYIDLANEYGKSAKAWWDAFLSVANSNGQVYARIYDVTHGIGVGGSDISLQNTAASTQVSSGQLSFWSGRNLYRVQVKSLNSFVVTFSSGRIKISY